MSLYKIEIGQLIEFTVIEKQRPEAHETCAPSAMETTQRPYLKSLGTKGYIRGCTISTRSSNTPLCHYFGGIRYALPPTKRWRKAQELPPTYSYGTKDRPYQCPGATQSCPQATFFNLSSTAAGNEDCFQCNVWVPLGDPPGNGMYFSVYRLNLGILT